MVQSSLSASLLGLEKELGTDLFIRGRKGAELTDAGRALLQPARAALDDAERGRAAGRRRARDDPALPGAASGGGDQRAARRRATSSAWSPRARRTSSSLR